MRFDPIWLAVWAAWIAFTLTFMLIARRSNSHEERRDTSSLVGLWLQTAGFFIAQFGLREPRSPLLPLPEEYAALSHTVLSTLAVGLAFTAVWLAAAALRALGKNWAYSARIIEGHKLVRSGPYGLVRHPIYTSMLFLNLATALAFARWEAALLTLILSLVGTWIRVRCEERLMQQAFGHEFTTYAASVPAIIPSLRFGRASSEGLPRSS